MKQRHRTLFVGCGGMSRAWLSAVRDHYADRVEIVGLVDLNPQAAAARAAEFGHAAAGAWTGASLDEALRLTAPRLLFNCTIPEAHAPVCEAALRAGCDVLVEKPLAPSVSDARRLARLAGETGRLFAVIQNRRYLPGAVAVRQTLERGGIGAVQALHADFFMAPRFGGFRETMPHPLLIDMAIHTFDQARHFTGLEARRVECREFNPAGSWFASGAGAAALFEMEGGIPFSYRGSWCARGFPTSWAGSWRIQGERGTLLWDGEDRIEVERLAGTWDGRAFYEPVERLAIPPAALGAEGREHAGNIGAFLDAIDSGTLPQTVAWDNLKSLAMVEAAVASVERGAPVDVEG